MRPKVPELAQATALLESLEACFILYRELTVGN